MNQPELLLPEITETLLRWYVQHKRELPWRETKDAYLIWLSEIILQQTRVEQGMPYYLQFREAFPTVSELADAPEDTVMKLWQGLGYYSRARNLHAAAKQVVSEFNGQFPTDYAGLIQLKGVGPYTAAAIASIAFDEPKAVVDGNVIRVISRLFGIQEPVNESATQKRIAALAESLLDHRQPGEHNQAIMDFGALQCVPKSPNCQACPLLDDCEAHRLGLVGVLPKKTSKTKRRTRFLHFLVASDGEQLLLQKRGTDDIWAGLYQFPMKETEQDLELSTKDVGDHLGNKVQTIDRVTIAKKHVLSHQDLFARFYHVRVKNLETSPFEAIKTSELHRFALPRLIDRYLEHHDLLSGQKR